MSRLPDDLRPEVERAVEMLNVATRWIRRAEGGGYSPPWTILYDEAECDGLCVADDCEIAAGMLAPFLLGAPTP